MASLNLGSVKGFLVSHVEKFLVAGVGVAFVWVAIQSVGNERLDFEPDTLSREATQTGTALDDLPALAPPEVVDYAHIATGIMKPIPSVYPTRTKWDPGGPTLGDPLRDEPDLYAVQELRGAGGSGAVRLRPQRPDEDADEEERPKTQEGQRWVVVVGKLPVMRQLETYQDAFVRSPFKDPVKDTPRYLFYEVERAEVGLWDAPGSEVWKKIGVRRMLDVARMRFAGSSSEPVAPQFLPPRPRPPFYNFAAPLPPLIGKSFGLEIAHDPDIPFLPPEMQPKPEYEGPTEFIPEAAEDDEKGYDELMDERGGQPGAGGMESGYGGMESGYGGMESGSGGMESGYGGMESGYGGMESGYGGMESGYGGMDGGYGGYGGVSREPIEFQLFRFFDYTVQPGRHYRYRVKLVMANPNFEVPPRYLAKTVLGEEKLLFTEWSDPTDTISVPRDSHMLIASATTSTRIETEPTAHIGVVRFDPETGDETFAEFDVGRGYYGNFLQVEVEEPEKKSVTSGYGGMFGGGEEGGSYGSDTEGYMMEGGDTGGFMSGGSGSRPTRPARRSSRRTSADDEEPEKVDYLTEVLLLDILGGKKNIFRNDSDATEPGMALVMDADGNLLIRRELEDLKSYNEYNPPEEETPRGGGGDGGYMDMEGDGGYGDMMGYGSDSSE